MKTSIFYLFMIACSIFCLTLSCYTYEKTVVSCPKFKSQRLQTNVKFRYFEHFSPGQKTYEKQKPGIPKIVQKYTPGIQMIQSKNFTLLLTKPNYGISVDSIDSASKGIVLKHPRMELPDLFISKKITMAKKIQRDFISKDSCDTIVFIYGKEIKAKILEIGKDSIKYQNCEGLEGIIMEIHKNQLAKIKFFDGRDDLIINESLIQKDPDQKKYENLSLWGFSFSILGILAAVSTFLGFGPGILLALLFFLTGYYCSIQGLKKIKANPEKYKSKTLAYIGKILSLIGIISLGIIQIILIIFLVVLILWTPDWGF